MKDSLHKEMLQNLGRYEFPETSHDAYTEGILGATEFYKKILPVPLQKSLERMLHALVLYGDRSDYATDRMKKEALEIWDAAKQEIVIFLENGGNSND